MPSRPRCTLESGISLGTMVVVAKRSRLRACIISSLSATPSGKNVASATQSITFSPRVQPYLLAIPASCALGMAWEMEHVPLLFLLGGGGGGDQ